MPKTTEEPCLIIEEIEDPDNRSIAMFSVYSTDEKCGNSFRVEGPLEDTSYVVMHYRIPYHPCASDPDKERAIEKAYELALEKAEFYKERDGYIIVDKTSRAKESQLETQASS